MKEALGVTGHVALAAATQNLVLAGILFRVVSNQGVKAFCTFAAIAIVFDFFYLLTFFTAVLSIDVRRLELSDSLTRATLRHEKYQSPEPQPKRSWIQALRRGEGPISTRVAGALVFVSFVLVAQWHFTDDESYADTVARFIPSLKLEQPSPRQANLLSIDVNQARTPTSWLRLQDHETAHEVINIVKPDGYSYIARVYDPLVFVLDGSDRTRTKFGVRPFLPAVYDFARHQSAPFIITVLLIVAGVSLLMNYLLWDEVLGSEDDDRPEDDPLLSVQTLKGGHSLDVVLLTSSKDGVIASVGLDRQIRVWDVRRRALSYVHDPDSDIDPFPVLAMAIDNDSNWLALLSKGRVALWNIPSRGGVRRWRLKSKVELPPVSFLGILQQNSSIP